MQHNLSPEQLDCYFKHQKYPVFNDVWDLTVVPKTIREHLLYAAEKSKTSKAEYADVILIFIFIQRAIQLLEEGHSIDDVVPEFDYKEFSLLFTTEPLQ